MAARLLAPSNAAHSTRSAEAGQRRYGTNLKMKDDAYLSLTPS
jgi:hypothetical protein